MSHYAVTAIGADRPGIVAAVTGVLMEHGCNLEDTSMTILRGHFAMMLVVAGPQTSSASDLEVALSDVAAGLDLVVAVRAMDDTVPSSPEGEAWTVAVYGADRPGIVHRVTSTLAAVGANVVELTTRVIGTEDRPVYAMVLGVTLPPGTDGHAVSNDLSDLARELGVECSMHPSEADIL
ncbi:MAG: amino acid-binding protein [Actinobacteria bacterium]|nr:MAG: amino acid-binding protein [Actinomycetota bacterium]